MGDTDVRVAARALLLEDAMDETLARADALAAAHPESAIAHRVVADLRYAAAVHAANADDLSEDARKETSEAHLRVARDALTEARRLAPDCVDVAASLGDVFYVSKMYGEAEAEFRRAMSVPCPSDPAENNAAYGIIEEKLETTAAERVQEARGRARLAYECMTVQELVPLAVERVLDAARQHGAAEGRKQGKRVAESFPNLARAQYLNVYMDLEFVRGLDASIDKRPFLRRTQTLAKRAALFFNRSPVIACFRAKLLYVLGEYDDAEKECRRALDMKDPDDPQNDCIPPGSISGENHGARLVALAAEFHELINRILFLANDYWSSMTSERQEAFLSVRLDVLQDEYSKIDSLSSITLSDVLSFVKAKGSWCFWICPICDSKKFLDPGLLLSHMCSKHPRAVLPRLQSIVDPKFSEKVKDSSLDGVSLSQDSDQKDVVTFDRRSDAFKWLFYAPSSGLRPKPYYEVRQLRRQQGNMFLERIKEKMKTLPADKSAPEFAEVLPEINDLWLDFLEASLLDYRAFIMTLARAFLWRELKKCMTEDQKAAAINTADINTIFTKKDDTDEPLNFTWSHEESEIHATESSKTEVDGLELSLAPISGTENVNDLYTKVQNMERELKQCMTEDQRAAAISTADVDAIFIKKDDTDKALKLTESYVDSEFHATESSETEVNGLELSLAPISVTENVNDLYTKVKNMERELKQCMTEEQKAAAISTADVDAIFIKDGTDGALKLTESNEESEIHATESSETAVNGIELSLAPINVTESVNGLDTKVKNLQIDPNSDSSITTPEVNSSDPNGELVRDTCPA